MEANATDEMSRISGRVSDYNLADEHERALAAESRKAELSAVGAGAELLEAQAAAVGGEVAASGSSNSSSGGAKWILILVALVVGWLFMRKAR